MEEVSLLSGLAHCILFALLGCLLLRCTSTHRETLAFQTQLFLWAFLIRFAFSLFLYSGGFISTLKDEDGSGWVVGRGLYQQWLNQGYSVFYAPFLFLESYQTSNRGYWYLLGSQFLVTGTPGRLPAAALNCLSGAFTIIIVYRVARSLFSETIATRAGWFGCFFPSLIVWSAQTIKEPFVILFETIALYACTRLKADAFAPRHVALIIIAIFLLYPFRFYAAYLAIATILVSLLVPDFSKGGSNLTTGITVSLILVGILAFSGTQVTKELQQNEYDLEYLQRFRHFAAVDQGSGVQVGGDLRTSTGFGTALIVGGLHLLFAPLPWQWSGSLRLLLVVPETIFWWGLFFYGVVPGLRHCVRFRLNDVLPLLIFILGMSFLYSLTFGNVGLVYRQRAQLLPWFLIFASVGIELRRRKFDMISQQANSLAA